METALTVLLWMVAGYFGFVILIMVVIFLAVLAMSSY